MYDPTLDMKTCGHILFEILSSNFCRSCRDLRYLRYVNFKVEKIGDKISVKLIASVLCRSQYRYSDMKKFTKYRQ